MKKLRSLLLLLLLLSVFTVGASAASYDGNGFGSDGTGGDDTAFEFSHINCLPS